MGERRWLLVDSEAALIARTRLILDSETEYRDSIRALTPQPDGEAIEVHERAANAWEHDAREVRHERDALRTENALLRHLHEDPAAVQAAYDAWQAWPWRGREKEDQTVWAKALQAAVHAVLKEET